MYTWSVRLVISFKILSMRKFFTMSGLNFVFWFDWRIRLYKWKWPGTYVFPGFT